MFAWRTLEKPRGTRSFFFFKKKHAHLQSVKVPKEMLCCQRAGNSERQNLLVSHLMLTYSPSKFQKRCCAAREPATVRDKTYLYLISEASNPMVGKAEAKTSTSALSSLMAGHSFSFTAALKSLSSAVILTALSTKSATLTKSASMPM